MIFCSNRISILIALWFYWTRITRGDTAASCATDFDSDGCQIILGSGDESVLYTFVKFSSSLYLSPYPFAYEVTSGVQKKPSKADAAVIILLEKVVEFEADDNCANILDSCARSGSRTIDEWPDAGAWDTDYNASELFFSLEANVDNRGVKVPTCATPHCGGFSFVNQIVGSDEATWSSLDIDGAAWQPANTSLVTATSVQWRYGNAADAFVDLYYFVDARDMVETTWLLVDAAGAAEEISKDDVNKLVAVSGRKLKLESYIGDLFIEFAPKINCDGSWIDVVSHSVWFEDTDDTRLNMHMRLPRKAADCTLYYTSGFDEGTIVTDFGTSTLTAAARLGLVLIVAVPVGVCVLFCVYCYCHKRGKKRKRSFF